MSDTIENTIIEIFEIKSEQVNSTIAPTVTKRIRKKKGEGKATNVVIIENKTDTETDTNIENSIVNEIITATDPDTSADNTIVK